MKKSTVVILSFLLASILFATHLPAKERAIKVKLRESERVNAPVVAEVDLYSDSYALVIGINNYTKGWPRLSGAVHDAELVAEVLREKGFQVTFRKDLNSRELKQAFKEFFIFKGENPQARLFVRFAGHGHTLDGERFLIPADAPRSDAGARFKYKALSMRRFREFVRLAKAKHALAVFDSCFSGTIFDTQRTAPPPAVTRATTLPVRQFLSSGDSNQKVSDDGRFRKLFIRAIRGEERADANRDSYLTGSELGLFLTDRLTNLTQSRQTPRYGKLRDEDWDRGDFVFRLASSSGVTIEEQAPTPAKAVLKVTSNVSGSSVFIDGARKGTAPLTLKGLTPGRHRIKVMREGYEPYEERICLRQEKRLTVKAILGRPSGTIEVTGRPAGAKVYLDGYYTGVMPVDPTQVQPQLINPKNIVSMWHP
ncbi:MAG: PEGA domain-containing protein [Deltaproteobacteria bacterium]|nr:PEGA domain-containing protein [Deltaproteobacteria bacterium]